MKTHKYIDNFTNQEDNINYSTECLNSFQPSGNSFTQFKIETRCFDYTIKKY